MEPPDFSKIIDNPETEFRKIVYSDILRRADVWQKKGVKNRTICEGILMASLEWIYQEEDFREWRWFCRHAIEQAENHKNRIEEILLNQDN